jgi:hypothetical protein
MCSVRPDGKETERWFPGAPSGLVVNPPDARLGTLIVADEGVA